MIRRIVGEQTEAAREAIRDLVEEAEFRNLVSGRVQRVEILIWRPAALVPSLADLEEVVLVTGDEMRTVILERHDLEWHLSDPDLELLAYVIADEMQNRLERLYWLVYERL